MTYIQHLVRVVTITVACLTIVAAQDKQATTQKNNKLKTTEAKKMDSKGKDIIVMETSMGTIEITLFREDAPKTVENFVKLAQKGYYNNLTFHRIIDNFMIQGGDPTGTGMGGESIYGKKFEDEISPKYKFDRAGLLAMANAGPNTNGSQFFITLVPTPWLNGKHTIFGEVTNGMDVVRALGKVKTSKPGDKPLVPVVMKNCYEKGHSPAGKDDKKSMDKKETN